MGPTRRIVLVPEPPLVPVASSCSSIRASPRMSPAPGRTSAAVAVKSRLQIENGSCEPGQRVRPQPRMPRDAEASARGTGYAPDRARRVLGTLVWKRGARKRNDQPGASVPRRPTLRPLVMFRSCRIVILSPLGTPLIHLEMWSPRWTLPRSDQLEDEVVRERLSLAGDLELHVGGEPPPGLQIGDAGRADEPPSWAPDANQDSRGVIDVLEPTDGLPHPGQRPQRKRTGRGAPTRARSSAGAA
jgi:hypothetical protein